MNLISELKQHLHLEFQILNQNFQISNQIKNNKLNLIKEDLSDVKKNLIPYMIETDGLLFSLENLFISNPFKLNHAVQFHFKFNPSNLNKIENLILYNIIYEGFQNIAKHAEANFSQLLITELKNQILVEISDNGIGFSFQQVIKSGHAFGLKSIMDNCTLLKSSVYIESSNSGTKISFQIPIAS